MSPMISFVEEAQKQEPCSSSQILPSVGGLTRFSTDGGKEMKVKWIMTQGAKTCRPDTSLRDAALTMWKMDCGMLPVVADGGRTVGVVTDRDICMAAATKGRHVGDIRVKEVITG